MTDGEPIGEIRENPRDETINNFLNKTSELLDSQTGLKYFRVHTPEGTKTARVWKDADKTRYIKGLFSKRANITIFSIMDRPVGSLKIPDPPYSFTEIVVVQSGNKRTWVYHNKVDAERAAEGKSNFMNILLKEEKISTKTLDLELSDFKANDSVVTKYNELLRSIKPGDEVPDLA